MAGSLWAFGLNSAGQLGTGTYTTYSSLARVGTDANWTYVDTSSYHTMAVKSTGTLWGWGDNSHGELGLGATASQFTPAQVGVGTDWVKVWCVKTSTGAYSLALNTGGSLFVAGTDTQGLLGLGATTSVNTFTQIGSQTYTTVRAGTKGVCAIQTNGTVVAWGNVWGTSPAGINRTGYTFVDAFPSNNVTYTDDIYGVTSDGALWVLQSPILAITQCGSETLWTGCYVGPAFNDGTNTYLCPIVRSDREIFLANRYTLSRRPLYQTNGYISHNYWTLLNSEPEIVSTVSNFKGHHAILSDTRLADVVTGEAIAPPYVNTDGWVDTSRSVYAFPKLNDYPVVNGVARLVDSFPTLPGTQAYFYIRSTTATSGLSFHGKRGALLVAATVNAPGILGYLSWVVHVGSETGALAPGISVSLVDHLTDAEVDEKVTNGSGYVRFDNLPTTRLYRAIAKPNTADLGFGISKQAFYPTHY